MCEATDIKKANKLISASIVTSIMFGAWANIGASDDVQSEIASNLKSFGKPHSQLSRSSCALLNAGDIDAVRSCAASSNNSTPSAKLTANSSMRDFQSSSGAHKDRVFPVSDRVIFEAPDHSLPLAESTPLHIRIAHPGLLYLISTQSVPDDRTEKAFHQLSGSEVKHEILNSAGASSIKIVPMALGTVRMNFVSIFADGGVSSDEVRYKVIPPNSRPLKLEIGYGGGGNARTMVLRYRAGEAMPQQQRVYAVAQYKTMVIPVDIAPKYLEANVREGNGLPVVSYDPESGILTPHRLGHSLLEVSYGGITHLTCIDVEAPGLAVSDRTQCSDLLRSGEQLGADQAK